MSGVRDNIRDAMADAEKAAARLTAFSRQGEPLARGAGASGLQAP